MNEGRDKFKSGLEMFKRRREFDDLLQRGHINSGMMLTDGTMIEPSDLLSVWNESDWTEWSEENKYPDFFPKDKEKIIRWLEHYRQLYMDFQNTSLTNDEKIRITLACGRICGIISKMQSDFLNAENVDDKESPPDDEKPA